MRTNGLPPIDPRSEYTSEQAAELCGVDRSTVTRWHRRGYVPARRLGQRLLLFRGSDLLKIRENPPGAGPTGGWRRPKKADSTNPKS